MPDNPSLSVMDGSRSASWLVIAAFLSAIVIAAVAFKGPVLYPDSFSYIDSHFYRPPVYPTLLALFRVLWGDAYQGALIILQAALICMASLGLVLFLKRSFDLPWALAIGCYFLLLFPCYNFSIIYGYQHIANNIMTEAISYAIFLLVLRQMLASALGLENKSYCIYLALVILAILTRPQFMFMHAVSALIFIYLFSKRKSNRSNLLAAGALLISFLAGPIIENVYNYIRNKNLEVAPFGIYQLMAATLYVSHREDADLLENGNREFFLDVYENAYRRGLLALNQPLPRTFLYQTSHYRRSYNKIAWGVLKPAIIEHLSDGEERIGLALMQGRENLKELTFILTRENFLGYLRLYLSNLFGAASLSEWFLILGSLVASAVMGLKRRNASGIALSLMIVTHLSNCALVALVEPVLGRYLFYTSVVYPVFFVVFIYNHLGPSWDGERRRI